MSSEYIRSSRRPLVAIYNSLVVWYGGMTSPLIQETPDLWIDRHCWHPCTTLSLCRSASELKTYDTNATCICLTLLKSYWSSLKETELWLIPCEMSCPWISKKKIQLVQLIVCIHCHELGLLTFWFRLTHSFLDSSYPPKLKFSFVHSDLLTPSLISQTYLNWDVPFSSSSCSGTRL